jgi:hypothetical protein
MTGALATTTQTVAAGSVQTLSISGSFVDCLAANQATFGLQIDSDPSAAFAQGLKFKMPGGKLFGSITIDNTMNVSALVVELAYGQGDFFDQRLIGTTALLQTLTTVPDVSCAPGAQTEILLPDTNRAYVIVANLVANPEPIRVGDINTGAARGLEVVPGDNTGQLETTSAIYVWNPHTAAVFVSIMVVEA